MKIVIYLCVIVFSIILNTSCVDKSNAAGNITAVKKSNRTPSSTLTLIGEVPRGHNVYKFKDNESVAICFVMYSAVGGTSIECIN